MQNKKIATREGCYFFLCKLNKSEFVVLKRILNLQIHLF